jgi:tRNA C32,U32 (ribose-2'-O)-methylase TrmJ
LGEIDGSAEPVTRDAADLAVARIAEDLRALGFFKQTGGSRLVDFLRDTVERSAYSPSELRYYENLFHKMAGLARKGLQD